MTLAEPAAGSTAQGSPPPASRPKRNKIKTGEGRLAFFLVTPTIALLGLIVGYPIVKAIYNAFLSDNQKINPDTGLLEQAGAWTGLTNFKHWLLEQCPSGTGTTIKCPPGNIGSQFWDSVSVTVGFTVVTVALETVIGMIFALMMNRAFRGRALVRAAILIPWAIPTAVTAKLWQVVFDPQGVLNKLLGTHFAWTSEKWPARSAIVIADVWKTTPFIALLILAGLQGISADIYESAKVDGANAWQRFWRITLPLVKPALAVAVIFRTLDVLRMYDLPAILTGGANGTTTLSILVVKQLHSGVYSASALSTITFIFIFAIALGMVRLFNANIVGTPGKGGK
ncbi:carbohydrate ABC transporter permease [Jatrophihabitans sp.]|uniref:carbohydrate ABC transporter permease n=1 Tax=Jatrophihabitans sp. TaxID=1932789 RepID=UPI002C421477|nr:sugar ABC transporter permease [Jatrophihabitans sp.]